METSKGQEKKNHQPQSCTNTDQFVSIWENLKTEQKRTGTACAAMQQESMKCIIQDLIKTQDTNLRLFQR